MLKLARLLSLCAVFAAAACGGGKQGSPAQPVPPDASIAYDGTWIGSLKEGGPTCFRFVVESSTITEFDYGFDASVSATSFSGNCSASSRFECAAGNDCAKPTPPYAITDGKFSAAVGSPDSPIALQGAFVSTTAATGNLTVTVPTSCGPVSQTVGWIARAGAPENPSVCLVGDDYFPLAPAEGLAPAPPMGWSSWNAFQTNVTADNVKAVADAMVSSGMKDAGYQYVNIDDGWALVDRAADGTVQVDATRFPDGIAAVADYMHGLGLKLGIYSSRGATTCAGRAGSGGHEQQDAESYAAWGVDYLKYDNCPTDDNADAATIQTQYQTMRDALGSVSRPIVYSLCAWKFYEWGLTTGQLWRTTKDIKDSWATPAGATPPNDGSFTSSLSGNRGLAAYAGPNSWNDPDMLEVGNGGMTDTEYRAHFSLWAMMAAPLIAGNNLATMSDATREILTNQEVIAVDQDALGLQGVPVRVDGELEVWAKPLNESGGRAVILFNPTASAQDITAQFADLGLGPGDVTVRDLWTHTDLGSFTDGYTATVPSHGVVMLKLKGSEPPAPTGLVFVSDLVWTYAANYQGPVEKDTSNGASAAGDGVPITLGGTSFTKGLGVTAPSLVIYRLGKACTRFSATVGLDGEAQGNGSVAFQVWADGAQLFDSGVLTGTSTASVDVDVSGKQRLRLLVTNGGDGNSWDRASWGDAKLECAF